MIFLGLGSNIGNRRANLQKAIEFVAQDRVELYAISGLYQTPAWGITDQADFYNAVIQIQTHLSPKALLEHTQGVEKTIGRFTTFKWGPRLIDIDILEYHRWQIRLPELTLPHPLYPQRAFVLQPLRDIVPSWVPTGQTHSVQSLLASLEETNIVKLDDASWYEAPSR